MGLRSAALLPLLIAADLAVFVILTTLNISAMPARLVALLISVAITALIGRLLARRRPAGTSWTETGLVPLIGISLILNLVIFVVLSSRAPEVRPLVYYGAGWLGSLLFAFLAGVRLWRRRR